MKEPSSKTEAEKALHMSEIVFDTNRRANEAFSREEQILLSNINIFWDTLLDVAKTVFTVSFTGFVALKVVDPKLVVAAQSVETLIVLMIAISLGLIVLASWRKMVNIAPITEHSKQRLNHIATMAIWERKISLKAHGFEDLINEEEPEESL